MKKFLILSIITALSFGFAPSKSGEEIAGVLSKMNSFYQKKAVQMTTQVTYYLKDNTVEKSLKTQYSQSKGAYLSKNKQEIILSNKRFNLSIDLVEKTMYLTEVEGSHSPTQAQGVVDGVKLLELCKDKSLSQTEHTYLVSLTDNFQEMRLTISKKDFHLSRFTTVFKDHSTYQKIEVNYELTTAKDQLNSSYFSEKNYIKKTSKGYVGKGKYKKFKLQFTPKKQH